MRVSGKDARSGKPPTPAQRIVSGEALERLAAPAETGCSPSLVIAEYPSARSYHPREGEVVVDEAAELTSDTRNAAPRAGGYMSREPSPLPFSSTMASGRSALVTMMQPADLRQLNHPAEFGSLRRPGFRCIAQQ